MAKGKKNFLPESIIQAFEKMDNQQWTDHLSALGRSELEETFTRFLRSYAIVRRCANAAWDFLKTGGLALDQLARCMHDYAPEYFPLHDGDLEVLEDEMDSLTAEMEGMSAEECRELIEIRRQTYRRLRALRREVAPVIPRTPK